MDILSHGKVEKIFENQNLSFEEWESSMLLNSVAREVGRSGS